MSGILTSSDREKLENTVACFLAQRGIKLEVPVDIFKLAARLDFDVRGLDLGAKVDGAVLVDERLVKIPPFESNKVIVFNIDKKFEDVKFIIGHELGHYIEEKIRHPRSRIMFAARDHRSDYSNNKEEQHKDYIAAAILVPRMELIKRYGNSARNDEDIAQAALDFKVDEQLMRRRFEEVFSA